MASGFGREIGVWRLLGGERIITLTGYFSCVTRIVFSPNGDYLICGLEDSTIDMWNFFIKGLC